MIKCVRYHNYYLDLISGEIDSYKIDEILKLECVLVIILNVHDG
jgi:hypothetical protein